MNSTVGILVTIFTLANIGALVWLLASVRRQRGESARTTETTGHVWDEDLRELNNPLPRWWLWLFVITTVFGLGYLVVYPGLGNYRGIIGWTSEREHAAQSAGADRLLEVTFEHFEHHSALE